MLSKFNDFNCNRKLNVNNLTAISIFFLAFFMDRNLDESKTIFFCCLINLTKLKKIITFDSRYQRILVQSQGLKL